MPTLHQRIVSLLIVLVTLTAAATNSYAEKNEGALPWGLLTLEASSIGVAAILLSDKKPAYAEVYLSFVPIGLGIGAGVLAKDTDPRGAYALYGGAAAGLNMFLFGSVLDAIGSDAQARMGSSAWVLGGMGVLGGAWFGATQIQDPDIGVAYFFAPLGGLVIGGVGTTLVSLVLNGSKDFGKGAVIGGAVGMSVGFAVPIIATLLDDGDQPSESSTRLGQPGNLFLPRAKIFSFGGSF